MNGVAIIRSLLVAHAPLTARVPVARIFAGVVPQGTALPAIAVTEISAYPKLRTTTRQQSTDIIESRVQVSVLVKEDNASYRALKEILLLTKMGRGYHNGIIAGVYVNSVEPYGTNPELPPGDDKIYEQSRDFMVTFLEPN